MTTWRGGSNKALPSLGRRARSRARPRHRRGTAVPAASGPLPIRTAWIVLAFAGTSLSGCVGSEQDAGGVAGWTEGAVLLTVQVVNRELYPLVDALVRLNETGVEARTGIDGTVAFAQLAPGTYHVFAEAPGYYAASRPVVLSFDEPDPLVLILDERPLLEPYHVVFIRSGISSCETPLVFGWFSFTELCTAAAGIRGNTWGNATFEDAWAFASLELTWKGSGWFALFVYPCGTTCGGLRDKIHGYRVGPNPVRLDAFPGETGVGQDRRFYVPFPKGAGKVETFTPYAGEFAEQINLVVPQTACGAGIHDQRCAGVGISVDRRFSLYVSQFYHRAPPDPKNYTALPDS